MKRLLAAAMILPGLVANARGQSAPLSEAAQAVLATDKGYWDAVNACDAERWSRLVNEDVVFITIPGGVHDKAILRYDHFGKPPCKHNYATDALRVRVYGDAAVVNGNFGYGGVDGQPRNWAAYTRMFVRQKGQWQVVAVHHGPALKAALKAKDGNLVTTPSQ